MGVGNPESRSDHPGTIGPTSMANHVALEDAYAVLACQGAIHFEGRCHDVLSSGFGGALSYCVASLPNDGRMQVAIPDVSEGPRRGSG